MLVVSHRNDMSNLVFDRRTESFLLRGSSLCIRHVLSDNAGYSQHAFALHPAMHIPSLDLCLITVTWKQDRNVYIKPLSYQNESPQKETTYASSISYHAVRSLPPQHITAKTSTVQADPGIFTPNSLIHLYQRKYLFQGNSK